MTTPVTTPVTPPVSSVSPARAASILELLGSGSLRAGTAALLRGAAGRLRRWVGAERHRDWDPDRDGLADLGLMKVRTGAGRGPEGLGAAPEFAGTKGTGAGVGPGGPGGAEGTGSVRDRGRGDTRVTGSVRYQGREGSRGSWGGPGARRY